MRLFLMVVMADRKAIDNPNILLATDQAYNLALLSRQAFDGEAIPT